MSETKALHFHIGQNDPGYLPDEVPYVVESAERAVTCLCEDLRSYAQDDDEGDDSAPPEGTSEALAGAIVRDDRAEMKRFLLAGKDISISLQRNNGMIRVFFAHACTDETCETES